MFGSDRAIGRDRIRETRPPGWLYLGREFTLLEPVGFPRDPAVTRAIRLFDPTAVPLSVRMCYLSPADEAGARYVKVFIRHALGRYDPFKRPSPELRSLEVPPSYRGPVPNIVERVSFCRPRTERPFDIPGDYIPWDWPLFKELSESFWLSNRPVEEMLQDEQQVIDTRQRDLESMSESFEHDFRGFERWALKKLDDDLTSEEVRLAMRQGSRAVMAQRAVKPVVFLAH